MSSQFPEATGKPLSAAAFNMGKGSSKLPDAGEVPAGLDSTLLQQLPEELRGQVIGQYREFKSQYDELQSSYERLRVDSGTLSPPFLN